MRDTFRIAILAAFLFGGCSTYDRELLGDPEPAQPAGPAYAEEAIAPEATDDSLGVGMFNELRYYGQWHWIEPHGWAWRPTAVSEWQPFVNGHWVWSQYGWTWVDYDPWGWATAHYGYWMHDFAMGWVWIPDYTWSPAQVDWMMYDDWACWSPVPPTGIRFKEPWEGENAWVSVPVRRFKDPNVGTYRAVPKYKAGESDLTMTRNAPQVGAGIVPIKVELERHVVGEREFAKVKFPPEQEQIIDGHRMRVKSNSGTAQFTPQATPTTGTPPPNHGGTVVGPTRPQTEVKSKPASSGSKSNNGSRKETKFKDRKSDEKKDDSKSKDAKPKDESGSNKKEKG